MLTKNKIENIHAIKLMASGFVNCEGDWNSVVEFYRIVFDRWYNNSKSYDFTSARNALEIATLLVVPDQSNFSLATLYEAIQPLKLMKEAEARILYNCILFEMNFQLKYNLKDKALLSKITDELIFSSLSYNE